ncbi:glycosyltransferase family A protein [Methylobacterium sp. J-076]|uniref:glycosyltransferase family A protein n=1 Tax=Methylobacterium sp. J-076 TaxID=2836655 RepID=UPI001FBB8CA2|nr:glycosyltransferase family A protein [Methylobacterium sp. J-076]MCJ2013382.1 glycosyltransferase family 2 protein [Methylobacterium sp. J-076]
MPGTEPFAVSVVIPTLNRHRALERALSCILAQQLPAGHAAEVIVVDNSIDGNAKPLVTRLAAAAAMPVVYVSVPRPGIATARNAGIAAARGRWIAFIDDDETCGPQWLASLLAVAHRGGFDAVFGPVNANADDGVEIGPFAAYFARGVTAGDSEDVTHRAPYLGTNNSLFSAAVCAVPGGPFEERLNSVGGEDSLFLQRLVLEERRFGWASQAEVTEWVPPRRLDWAYVRRRRFLSGQIRTFVNEMVYPRRRIEVARWMAVGVAQTIVSGALSLILKPINPPAARHHRIAACGGLGKVFWMTRFRGSLYGTGLVS